MAELSKTGRKVLTDLAGGKWALWYLPVEDGRTLYKMSAATFGKRYGVHPNTVRALVAAGYLARHPTLAYFIITRAGLEAIEPD